MGTESCQATHLGHAMTGRIHVVMDDGQELDIVPGDGYLMQPGHDAWVEGDEAFTGLEFQSRTAETYATS